MLIVGSVEAAEVSSSFPSTGRFGFRPSGGCICGLWFSQSWKEKLISLLTPLQTWLESRKAKKKKVRENWTDVGRVYGR